MKKRFPEDADWLYKRPRPQIPVGFIVVFILAATAFYLYTNQ